MRVKVRSESDLRLCKRIRAKLDRRLLLAAEAGEPTRVQPLTLWAVASWIHDGCTRPTTGDAPDHWGERPGRRRRRGGHDWLVLSTQACAEATLLRVRTVQNAVRELVRLALVECYKETRRPPPSECRDHREPGEVDWYGPNTQVVRVVLEPPRRAEAAPSWGAS